MCRKRRSEEPISPSSPNGPPMGEDSDSLVSSTLPPLSTLLWGTDLIAVLPHPILPVRPRLTRLRRASVSSIFPTSWNNLAGRSKHTGISTFPA